MTQLVQSHATTHKIEFSFDVVLFLLTMVIFLFGLTALYSASVDVVYRSGGQSFYLFNKQLAYGLIGIAASVAIYNLPISIWHKLSPYLLVLSFILLITIQIPGLGKSVNGATRWLDLGFIRLQVAELVKLFLIIYMSGYLLRRASEVNAKLSGLIKPVLISSLLAFLLLVQPDFGAAFVLFAIVMLMLFVAGVNLIQFTLFVLAMVFAFVMLIISSAYRMQRISSFMDPWSDPFNTGFQLTQSLIAFGSGGVFGMGLGESVQKLFYLPEAYNDFLLAIIAEELGAVGVIAVLFLYLFLVLRILLVAKKALAKNNLFNAYMSYGIACWFMIQVFISYGVNMGLLPTKGLTLPLMSAGGSSLVVMLVSIALVLRVSHENACSPFTKKAINND